MKKLIKLNIENTTNLREIEDSFCEVYSHDRNNGSFEFEINNDTLANETVTALFKFLRTGGYWKTTGTIEDNKIKVKFDTSLITQNEDVVCYLYLDDTERDSDIFSFKFRVKLSELDKSNQLIHKERYINNNVVIDRLNVVTHEDLEKVKSLIPVDVVNAEDLNKEIKRIEALETKADNDTVYDDSDLQKRVKAIEDKPEVDIENFATKKELEEVSNRQVTVDTSNLVTKDVFDSELGALSRSIPVDLYQTFDESTVPEYLKGIVELELKPRPITISAGQLLTDRAKWYIAKGDLENEKYVNFHATLYSLANSLPDFYNLEDVEKDIDNNNVIFLTTKNFADYAKGDINNLATMDDLRDLEQTYLPRGLVEVTEGAAVLDYIKKYLNAERVNNGEYLGRLFNNSKSVTRVLKQKNGDEFEFVYFEGAMITLANVLPKDYDYQAFNDPEKRVTLLTDRNFKEMVATPAFKAVVKESLRDIVKEIMREEN